MPEVEKAAEILQSETPPMSLAKVDCTNEDNVEIDSNEVQVKENVMVVV